MLEKVKEASPEKMNISVSSPGPEAFSRHFEPLPPGIENIDTEDLDNPQLVAEYVQDIYCYMRQLEVSTLQANNAEIHFERKTLSQRNSSGGCWLERLGYLPLVLCHLEVGTLEPNYAESSVLR